MWEQEMEPETGRVLLRGHYVVDRKLHRISLTREGMMRVLALLGVPPIHLFISVLVLPNQSCRADLIPRVL